jgi:uncharacterized protein (UPF0332 family)
VKPGRIDKRFLRIMREAYDLRIDSDYQAMPAVTAEQARAVVDGAREFLAQYRPLVE